VSCFSK